MNTFVCLNANLGNLTLMLKNNTKSTFQLVIFPCIKICYDNIGRVPYKGRNFNTQIFWKMYLFVICMISRHWFQTQLLLYIA